ncbi:MAG TPA: segregation/condensation protein A, partial [Thermoleophilaceae bacterium]|nr:segregation/condensation protein A [Thermoleophilaceae bacterium]
LRMPEPISLHHVAMPTVSVEQRLKHLRSLLSGRGKFTFDEAVEGADRVTVAVTLFALLELYKQGEVSWEQPENFGKITIQAGRRPEVGGRREALS